MNYAISKPTADGRKHTFGLRITDGTVVVVPGKRTMTDKLDRLERFGYTVEETESKPGIYSIDDWKVEREKDAKKHQAKSEENEEKGKGEQAQTAR